MSLKKYLHLFIFAGLTFLLPFLLYITDGGTLQTGQIIREDSSSTESCNEDRVNYYSYLCSDLKEEIDFSVECKDVPPAGSEADYAAESGSGEEPPPADQTVQQDQPAATTGENGSTGTGSSSGSSQDNPTGTGQQPAQPAESRVEEPEQKQEPAAGSVSLSSKEQQMINMINEARINAGVPALQVNSQLTSAARAKSSDMVNNNYFSHQSPTYGDLGGLLKRYSVSYRCAGENLAMNSNGSVSAAHNSLMGSSGHRSNILDRRFSHVGVGIKTKSDGTHYYTQLFTGQ